MTNIATVSLNGRRDWFVDLSGARAVWADEAAAREQIRLLKLTGGGRPKNFTYEIVEVK